MKQLIQKISNLKNSKSVIATLVVSGVALIVYAVHFAVTTGFMGKIIGHAKEGLQRAVSRFGKPFAQDVERGLRLETAHFTSGQWLKCGSAGMEVASGHTTFPFGWDSLKTYADAHGLTAADFSTYTMAENGTGKSKTFIVWRDTGLFVDFYSWFIQTKRHGDVVSWFLPDTAANAAKRAQYRASLNAIKPVFTA